MKKKFLIRQGFRRGFTLIELIVVIVIMAGLAYVVINKVLANSKSSQLTSIVNNDVAQIVKAVNKWKENDSASDGTFNGLTTDSVCPYLPNNMYCANGKIYSSGYHTTAGGGEGTSRIYYQLTADKITNDNDSFKIFADASDLANAEHWDDRTKAKFEKIVTNAMKRNSIQPQNVTIDLQAQGLGNPNDAFDPDSGTDNDAMAGARGLVQ